LRFLHWLVYRVSAVSVFRRGSGEIGVSGRVAQYWDRFPRKTVVSTFAVQGQVNRPRSRQRSRITNGSLLPSITDGRSAWVRRCKDVIAAITSDLGGSMNCSFAELSIVRRASVLIVELEMLEAKFAALGQANQVDLDAYIRGSGCLRRLLESVGMKRRLIDRTPTLSDILRGPPR
jgi:hypothetical protein